MKSWLEFSMKISRKYKDIKVVTGKVMDFIYKDLYNTIG